MELSNMNLLGINGLGRIGKLNLWKHIILDHFDGFVVNCGREVGNNLDALIQTIDTDSTYGNLSHFLYGHCGKKYDLQVVDEEKKIFYLAGKYVKILSSDRNPKDIKWAPENVRLVVDCTGKFLDPTIEPDQKNGSVRGHIEGGGAEKVIVSAPFKIKDKNLSMPEDAGMFVYGVNHTQFAPEKHNIISAASCTTTALAHMMKPLVETRETNVIVTASMSTIHATTNSQSILDSVPKSGAKDLRKSRSIMNNMIITSTGAAKALEKILPEISKIGFMADSVRIPTSTASLITLNITLASKLNDSGEPTVTRSFINNMYKRYADGPSQGLLVVSDRQNVSGDFIGYEAACIIEGAETHTRTGFIDISSDKLAGIGIAIPHDIQIPVTHAKIYGWYDNEFGSYVNNLARLAIYVDKEIR